MSKYVLMGLIFSYLVMITLISNALIVTVSEDVADGITVMGASDVSILDLLSTFWKLLTFQVDIPLLANIIFIYPAVIVLLYMMADIVKDIIPFT